MEPHISVGDHHHCFPLSDALLFDVFRHLLTTRHPDEDVHPFGLRDLPVLQHLHKHRSTLCKASRRFYVVVLDIWQHVGPPSILHYLLIGGSHIESWGNCDKAWLAFLDMMKRAQDLLDIETSARLQAFAEALAGFGCWFALRMIAFPTECSDRSHMSAATDAVCSFADWGTRGVEAIEEDTNCGLRYGTSDDKSACGEDTKNRKQGCVYSELTAIRSHLRFCGAFDASELNEGFMICATAQLLYQGTDVRFSVIAGEQAHVLKQVEVYVVRRSGFEGLAAQLAFDNAEEPSARAFALHGYLIPFWR